MTLSTSFSIKNSSIINLTQKPQEKRRLSASIKTNVTKGKSNGKQ
ncbi:hypothetical protein PROPEN_01829 [Proteus penneri ATCC 35198]|nr:hypothetical protein PROPEN_01829 [Proteus penneri ATCC 35198]